MPRTTPFHTRVAALSESQSWLLWAGFLSPVTYETDHLREYFALRSSAGLIDVSPLFKYDVTGPDAGRVLDRVVTRDLSRCAVHQAVYTPWCDPDGKVVDDGVVSRLAEDRYRLTLGALGFTDLVESTALATKLGDKSWSDILDQHYHSARAELEKYRGREVNTTGDGLLAVFDALGRRVAVEDLVAADRVAMHAARRIGDRRDLHRRPCMERESRERLLP
jgi:hypothetical protein